MVKASKGEASSDWGSDRPTASPTFPLGADEFLDEDDEQHDASSAASGDDVRSDDDSAASSSSSSSVLPMMSSQTSLAFHTSSSLSSSVRGRIFCWRLWWVGNLCRHYSFTHFNVISY